VKQAHRGARRSREEHPPGKHPVSQNNDAAVSYYVIAGGLTDRVSLHGLNCARCAAAISITKAWPASSLRIFDARAALLNCATAGVENAGS
jgi:hypothetical protein